jgi:hypothetical protein
MSLEVGNGLLKNGHGLDELRRELLLESHLLAKRL